MDERVQAGRRAVAARYKVEGDELRPRPRRRRDRRDHLLHQHLQPERDDRRRPARAQRGRQGPDGQAVGQDLARARQPGRRRTICKEADLQKPLDKLGFNIVGFGCTTCIGNSGPLAPEISATIAKHDLVAAAVLSGNRNFEGRVNPDVRANYLASPPLVVAYALAGSMQVDLTNEPLGTRQAGQAGLSRRHLADDARRCRTSSTRRSPPRCSRRNTRRVRRRRQLAQGQGPRRPHLRLGHRLDLCAEPALFRGHDDRRRSRSPTSSAPASSALFLDSITTDHISPAGSIKAASPAGAYLIEHQVRPADFNQYGTRRGNHEVMMRGTFANIRIKNQMVKDADGQRGRRRLHDASALRRAHGDL